VKLELSLVRSGVVSPEHYVEAVARRERERTPLGQIAIEEGVLGAAQVLTLLREKYTQPEKRFGELAVAHGMLRPEQVALLLMQQQERQRPVIDYLMELGRLSVEQAESARKKHDGRPATPDDV